MPPAPALTLAPDIRPGWDEAERRAALDWLQTVPDEFLACRGRHNFPKLFLRNGALPEGVRADRQQDRSYNITETCPDCGTQRNYSTVPDGWLGGLKQNFDYVWPEHYRVPKNAMSYITVSDMKAELWRRTRETLDAAADRAAKRTRRGGGGNVPATRFASA